MCDAINESRGVLRPTQSLILLIRRVLAFFGGTGETNNVKAAINVVRPETDIREQSSFYWLFGDVSCSLAGTQAFRKISSLYYYSRTFETQYKTL